MQIIVHIAIINTCAFYVLLLSNCLILVHLNPSHIHRYRLEKSIFHFFDIFKLLLCMRYLEIVT